MSRTAPGGSRPGKTSERKDASSPFSSDADSHDQQWTGPRVPQIGGFEKLLKELYSDEVQKSRSPSDEEGRSSASGKGTSARGSSRSAERGCGLGTKLPGGTPRYMRPTIASITKRRSLQERLKKCDETWDEAQGLENANGAGSPNQAEAGGIGAEALNVGEMQNDKKTARAASMLGRRDVDGSRNRTEADPKPAGRNKSTGYDSVELRFVSGRFISSRPSLRVTKKQNVKQRSEAAQSVDVIGGLQRKRGTDAGMVRQQFGEFDAMLLWQVFVLLNTNKVRKVGCSSAIPEERTLTMSISF